MSIEAMKMALRSLKELVPDDTDFAPALQGQRMRKEKAITALRQAIEQAEKQEPVAWQVMVEDEAMKEFPIKDMAHDWCVHQKLSGSSYSYWIRPLYTSPPPRQPLTDEEIERIEAICIEPVDGTGWGFINRNQFARAIEAAHGIKGEA